MTVNQAFRHELEPTARQRSLLAQAAGTARYAIHWRLHLCKRLLNAGKPVPHAAEMHRRWNAEKPQRSWVHGLSQCCGQEALRDLDRACANFWRGRKEGRRVGFPRFRRSHGRRDSFRLTGSIRVGLRSVTLPRLGGVRTKERAEKFRGRILSAAESREAGRWYGSLAVDVERDDPQPVEGPVAGIDLGLQSFAVRSDGSLLESPKPLAKAQRGWRNRRTDFLHRATTGLAKTRSVIVVEDLSVRGMIRNRHLSRFIADSGWSEFRRMPEAKTPWYGSALIVAPRSYRSTKTCSACGHIKDEMPLGDRVFRSEACGLQIDRDLNAACNLGSLVAGSSSETQNACGAEGSGQENRLVQPAASQQEPSSRKGAALAVGNKRL